MNGWTTLGPLFIGAATGSPAWGIGWHRSAGGYCGAVCLGRQCFGFGVFRSNS